MKLSSDLFSKCCSLPGIRRVPIGAYLTACTPDVHHLAAVACYSTPNPRPGVPFTREKLNIQPTIRPIQLRAYASLSGTIALSLDEAARSVAGPQTLAGCRSVQLSFSDWQRWDGATSRHDQRYHSKLSHVLGALNSSPYVDSVFLALSDILALPLESRVLPNRRDRTPVTILASLAIEVEPIDLGVWGLPHYPSVSIREPAVMKVVQEARKYNGNASAWHRVIARSGPTYQAFDFTASFHSRDFRSRIGSTTQSTALVDFGPYGSKITEPKTWTFSASVSPMIWLTTRNASSMVTSGTLTCMKSSRGGIVGS